MLSVAGRGPAVRSAQGVRRTPVRRLEQDGLRYVLTLTVSSLAVSGCALVFRHSIVARTPDRGRPAGRVRPPGMVRAFEGAATPPAGKPHLVVLWRTTGTYPTPRFTRAE